MELFALRFSSFDRLSRSSYFPMIFQSNGALRRRAREGNEDVNGAGHDFRQSLDPDYPILRPRETGARADLIGVAIDRAQAQYPVGAMPGSAESAANLGYRSDAEKVAALNFQSLNESFVT